MSRGVCPNCGGSLDLRSPGLSTDLVCTTCRVVTPAPPRRPRNLCARCEKGKLRLLQPGISRKRVCASCGFEVESLSEAELEAEQLRQAPVHGPAPTGDQAQGSAIEEAPPPVPGRGGWA